MTFDSVRAWKNEAYRMSLSEEERNQLAESPVGDLELSDADLEAVHGGHGAGEGEGEGHGPALFSLIICRSVVIVGDC